jgi:hypothetical protein
VLGQRVSTRTSSSPSAASVRRLIDLKASNTKDSVNGAPNLPLEMNILRGRDSAYSPENGGKARCRRWYVEEHAQPLPGKIIGFAEGIQRVANTFIQRQRPSVACVPSRPPSSATTTTVFDHHHLISKGLFIAPLLQQTAWNH